MTAARDAARVEAERREARVHGELQDARAHIMALQSSHGEQVQAMAREHEASVGSARHRAAEESAHRARAEADRLRAAEERHARAVEADEAVRRLAAAKAEAKEAKAEAEAAAYKADDRRRLGEQEARRARQASKQARSKAESLRMRAIAAEYRVMRLADANASAEQRRKDAERSAKQSEDKASRLERAVHRLRRLVYGASAAAPETDAFGAASEGLAGSRRAARSRIGRGAGAVPLAGHRGIVLSKDPRSGAGRSLHKARLQGRRTARSCKAATSGAIGAGSGALPSGERVLLAKPSELGMPPRFRIKRRRAKKRKRATRRATGAENVVLGGSAPSFDPAERLRASRARSGRASAALDREQRLELQAGYISRALGSTGAGRGALSAEASAGAASAQVSDPAALASMGLGVALEADEERDTISSHVALYELPV